MLMKYYLIHNDVQNMTNLVKKDLVVLVVDSVKACQQMISLNKCLVEDSLVVPALVVVSVVVAAVLLDDVKARI